MSKKGGKAGDFHDLPTDVQIRLQAGNVHELLYQDVNRWLQDNGYNPHMETPDWLAAESFEAGHLNQYEDCPKHPMGKNAGHGWFNTYQCQHCGKVDEFMSAESFSAEIAEEKQSEGFILGSVGVIGLFAISLFAAMKFQNKKKAADKNLSGDGK